MKCDVWHLALSFQANTLFFVNLSKQFFHDFLFLEWRKRNKNCTVNIFVRGIKQKINVLVSGLRQTYVFHQSVLLSYPRMYFEGLAAPFASASRIVMVALIYWLTLQSKEAKTLEKSEDWILFSVLSREVQPCIHAFYSRCVRKTFQAVAVVGGEESFPGIKLRECWGKIQRSGRNAKSIFTFFPNTFALYFRRHLADNIFAEGFAR